MPTKRILRPRIVMRPKRPAQQDTLRPGRRGGTPGLMRHSSTRVDVASIVKVQKSGDPDGARVFAEGPLNERLTALAKRHDNALYEVLSLTYAAFHIRAPKRIRAALMEGLGVDPACERPFLAVFKAFWPGAKGQAGKKLHNRFSEYARALTAAETRKVRPEKLAEAIKEVGGVRAYGRKPQARPDAPSSRKRATAAAAKPISVDRASEQKIMLYKKDREVSFEYSNRVQHLLLTSGGYVLVKAKVITGKKTIKLLYVSPA